MELTRDYILSKISQVEIFEKYLGVQVDLNESYYSVTREEEEPSCRFYFSNKRLRFKDFGDISFNVDCFDLVGKLYGKDSNNKIEFIEILSIIAKDFNLIKYINPLLTRKKLQKSKLTEKVNKEVQYELCEMTPYDLEFWKLLNIDSKLLKKTRYYRVSKWFIDGYRVYVFNVFKPVYIGLEGIGTDGNIVYQFYSPYKEKKERYYHNKNVTRLLDLLEPCEYCLVTKSRKDAIVGLSFNIPTIALGSETNYLTEGEVNYVKTKTKCKVIFSLFDYDKTGKLAAAYHRRKYGIIPLFLKPDEHNFKGKDLSDYVLEKGVENTEFFIKIKKEEIRKKYAKYF